MDDKLKNAPDGQEQVLPVLTRLDILEGQYQEMEKTLNAINNQIQELLKLAKESLSTEIKNLEDAYGYSSKISDVFNKL